jgi:hypothetical protein
MIRRLMSAVLVLLVAGCAQIPTAVDVKTGPEIAAKLQQDFSYYTPSGPLLGATAQEIVSGFLAAGTGPQNDYAVARSFLSSEFAQKWQPNAAVLIRSGAPVFRVTASGVQVVSLPVTAKLDEHGRYLPQTQIDTTSLRFQMTQEQGQWRIASAPNLTVVTPPVFNVVFKPLNVYFFDNQYRRLVADLRWFPTRASTGTRLVNALLAGPSQWLIQGVETAIPANTKLTIDAVRIESGTAQVDFDANALSANSTTRRLMLSQLRATLLQLGGVNDVSVSVNNSPQEIIPAPITPISSGAEGLMLTDGLYRIGPGQPQVIPGTVAAVERVQPYLAASNSTGNRLALAGAGGVQLISGGGLSTRTNQVSTVANVAGLHFDPDGLLWVVASRPGSEIEILDEDGMVATLGLPGLGRRISAALSPDGARLAVIMDFEGTSRLEIFTVMRDGQNRPTKINRGTVIDLVVGDPVSFSWQNQVSIRVLERQAGERVLSEYPLFGPRVEQPTPPIAGRKIVVGQSTGSNFLLATNGEVWLLSGGTWRKIASDAIDIAPMR